MLRIRSSAIAVAIAGLAYLTLQGVSGSRGGHADDGPNADRPATVGRSDRAVPPDFDGVVNALRRFNRWGPQQRPYILSAWSSFNRARWRISRKHPGVRVLTRPQVQAVLTASDVVICCDNHYFGGIARAFPSLIDLLHEGSPTADRSGMAIMLEPLIWLRGDPQGARDIPLQDLLNRIRAVWPYPVAPYESVLCHAAANGHVLLFGDCRRPPSRIDMAVPDHLRTPLNTRDWETLESEFRCANGAALKLCRDWVGEASSRGVRRRVAVLIGIVHALSKVEPLVDQLRDAGLTVSVIVPFEPEWELQLISSYGRDIRGEWVEVLDGVIRAPLVSDETLIRMSDVEVERARSRLETGEAPPR